MNDYNGFNQNDNNFNQNNNMNEFSYRPPKKNTGRKILTGIVAVLSVVAVGATSIVGYTLVTGNSISTSSEASETTRSTKSSTDDSSSQSSVDRSNLPTIEQLSTPSDALSIPEIVEKVSPSVVGISCMTDEGTVTGTGIIMSEDGYIITNAHVVDDATAISVVLPSNYSSDTSSDSSSDDSTITPTSTSSDDDESTTITAELVGKDTQTDLAVVKIDKTGLTAAEFGTSSELQVGEAAIVIGNPLGFDLANSVTAGIISATDRTLTIEDRTMNLIQTDASINSGNSGGPLINAYGQVIGITSAKVSSTYGEGLGFAIPIDEATPIIDDLIQYGYVTGRPSLGISGQNVTDVYSQYYDIPKGFFVMSVEDGSAAENAGIEVNDIVVGIEGTLIESIEEFNEIKENYSAGDTITVSVYRDGEILDKQVTLDEAVETDDDDDDSSSEQQQDNYDSYRQFFNQYQGY